MSYKIIVDSCGELTEEMKASGHFETASLQIVFKAGGRVSGMSKIILPVAGKIYGRISL